MIQKLDYSISSDEKLDIAEDFDIIAEEADEKFEELLSGQS